ncbi:SGNH/GDSL hydrolase family protein [Virgibacillus sediminis]|uniref:SGNH/GDSL hydrolase family protein n=1 Tax=Virgibacillus sediminis TaxID=202260 RepID=A0ABV7A3V4_9BACI
MTAKRVVFIGDSITDAGRRTDPDQIGTGYVQLVHDYLLTSYPDKDWEILNRGVGGDRIIDLRERWQEDVLDLKPDVLSISIGINDVWRQLDEPNIEHVTPEQFEQIYGELLGKVKEETDAKIILMEPTVIEEDPFATGNEKLKPYVDAVQRTAEKFDTVLVPTHDAFIHYLGAENGEKLTTDGVHMNQLGNMLMATTWIKAVKEFIM